MKRGIVLIGLLLVMAHASFGQKEISEDTPWGFRDRAYSALGFGGLGGFWGGGGWGGHGCRQEQGDAEPGEGCCSIVHG